MKQATGTSVTISRRQWC